MKDEYDALIANQAHLEQQVKYLLDQMRLVCHREFGASSEKSEYDGAQLNLFSEAEVFSAPEAEPELVGIEKHYRKRTCLTTDKLPDDLPVEVVEHGLRSEEQHCAQCGGALHVMGPPGAGHHPSPGENPGACALHILLPPLRGERHYRAGVPRL